MGSFSTEAVSSSGSSCLRHSSSELSFSIFLPVESGFCFFSLYNRTETRIASNENENTATNLKNKILVKKVNCQARVQVQGLSQISDKRPGPGACSYNCNVSTHHPPPTHKTFLSRITLKSLHV